MNVPSPLRASSLLNRRLERALTYTVAFFCVGTVLLLLANRRRLARLDEFLSADLPEFFQSPSKFYIADISIRDCGPLNWRTPACATPKSSEGHLGDVGLEGGWRTLNKDILLGSGWFTKKYLSVKKVSAEYCETNRVNVITDVVVASKNDCDLKGNKMCLPRKLLVSVNGKKAAASNDELHNAKRDENDRSFGSGLSPISSHLKRLSIKHIDISTETLKIPSLKEVAGSGWESRGYGIWIKHGPTTHESPKDLDFLFGHDAVEPRPGWYLNMNPLLGLSLLDKPLPRITVRRGRSELPLNVGKLQFDKDGKFKIMQVADIHFSTGVGICRDPFPEESAEGCQADPRTLKFLNKVLDLERPDFVAFTGDQIFGEGAPDPQTALFKVVMPLITRGIPYAMTVGNHDDESTMTRQQIVTLAATLPYSYTSLGDPNIEGYGNYQLTIDGQSQEQAAADLYFMDSHSYSLDPKNDPGYDYFKPLQIEWISSNSKESTERSNRLSMVFFHIPLPEYRNLDQPIVGECREGITAPKKNTRMRSALARAGVQVASCGHDHANDYCLLDSEEDSFSGTNKIWLCYGGGSGEGGYGGYGGFVRRLRVFDLDAVTGSIYTWKRRESDPENRIDQQQIVANGEVHYDGA